jgi:hypothetical protein
MDGWRADTRRYDLALDSGLAGEVTWLCAAPAWGWVARRGHTEIAAGRAATAVEAMRRCEIILRSEQEEICE